MGKLYQPWASPSLDLLYAELVIPMFPLLVLQIRQIHHQMARQDVKCMDTFNATLTQKRLNQLKFLPALELQVSQKRVSLREDLLRSTLKRQLQLTSPVSPCLPGQHKGDFLGTCCSTSLPGTQEALQYINTEHIFLVPLMF